MASPRSDSYSGASGADLTVGRNIVNGVWTPPRQADGTIALSAFNELKKPGNINKWFKVAGTEPSRIYTQCLARFGINLITNSPRYQYGNIATADAVLRPWSSPIIDYANHRLYWYATGGHHDSSLNLTASFDFATMRFDCITPPSNPDDPTYPWTTEYKNAATFTPWLPPPPAGSKEALYGSNNILPDGRPTSTHVYNEGVHDPDSGGPKGSLIRTIGRRWDFDLDTNAENYFFYKNGSNYGAGGGNGTAFFDRVNRRVWTSIARSGEGYNWHYFPADKPASGDEQPIVNVGTWFPVFANGACMMDDHRILMVGRHGDGMQLRACIFDMWAADAAIRAGMTPSQISAAAHSTLATGPGGVAEVINGVQDELDMPGLIHIPDWGSQGRAIILRTRAADTNDSKWGLIDIATQTELPYTPPGTTAPMNLQAYWGKSMGAFLDRKLAYHVDPMNPSQPSVYVMQWGPQ